jgi:hypothetical protein
MEHNRALSKMAADRNKHLLKAVELFRQLSEVITERDSLREQVERLKRENKLSHNSWAERAENLEAKLSSLQSQEAPWIEIKEGCEFEATEIMSEGIGGGAIWMASSMIPVMMVMPPTYPIGCQPRSHPKRARVMQGGGSR